MDLRQARFERRMSQWQLAKESGVHQSRISLAERHGWVLRQDEKVSLAKALGLQAGDIDWPLGETR